MAGSVQSHGNWVLLQGSCFLWVGLGFLNTKPIALTPHDPPSPFPFLDVIGSSRGLHCAAVEAANSELPVCVQAGKRGKRDTHCSCAVIPKCFHFKMIKIWWRCDLKSNILSVKACYLVCILMCFIFLDCYCSVLNFTPQWSSEEVAHVGKHGVSRFVWVLFSQTQNFDSVATSVVHVFNLMYCMWE